MLAVYLKPRVLIVLFLGFSAGLPLALSGSTLLVWMREAGVDLGTIGLFALVGTPYTIKFLWAPIVDALDVPVLSRLLGRRRGWLLLSQLLLIAAIAFLGFCDPAVSPWLVAFGALLVATASATQDIVIDAFRIESLPENEQAAGMASYVAAYRIGMLARPRARCSWSAASRALGFAKTRPGPRAILPWRRWSPIGIVDHADRDRAREIRRRRGRACRACGRIRSRASPPRRTARSPNSSPRDMAFVVLAFVVLYKFCDAFAGAMTAPFVIDLGFTRNDYATIVKGVGLAATLIGGFAGGALARAYPLVTASGSAPCCRWRRTWSSPGRRWSASIRGR